MSLSLTAGGQRLLLDLARRAIGACLAGTDPPAAPAEASLELREPRGVFVTLRGRDGDLRGCVGYPEPRMALLLAVSQAAVAAATRDGRFEGVREVELPELRIEISVLGPLTPLRPEDVRVGIHGLVIRSGGASGLLLPQVATEHGWDRETFLERLCSKAGLPPGAWRGAQAELQGFTAFVFGED